MKIGVSLYSYAADLRCRKMTVRDAMEHVAKLGIKGIEVIGDMHLPQWPYTSIADLIDFRKMVQSYGLEIICLSTYLNVMLRSDRKQTLEECIETAKNHIIMAHTLGSKIVRPTYYETKEGLVTIIKASVPVLKEYGITWAIEVHAPFPPSYYSDVVRQVNSPSVKLLPDFSCWQTAGLPTKYSAEDVASFKEIMPDVVYCHGKAHTFDIDGEEPNTPYRTLLGVLKDAKYKGYVSAEYEGWLMRYTDSRKVVKVHVDLLRKYGM